MHKSSRLFFTVAPLIAVCGLIITAIYTWTSPRIAEQQRRATEAIYLDALQLKPGAAIQFDSTHTTDDSALLGLRSPRPVYIARANNRVIGVVLPLTAREGYMDDIDLLLGVDTNGKVISVHVLSQRETRGIGDNIERGRHAYKDGDWLDQFDSSTFSDSEKNRWQLRSEGGAFDGITGATVTSRAVIKAVQQGLVYFAQHRNELLETADNE